MALHYDVDFYGWTQAQAEALKAEKWELLDVANLAEEIESLEIHHVKTLRHRF